MECEYNIRCGELVSDSIHIHSCDDNYDGADNDDRDGWWLWWHQRWWGVRGRRNIRRPPLAANNRPVTVGGSTLAIVIIAISLPPTLAINTIGLLAINTCHCHHCYLLANAMTAIFLPSTHGSSCHHQLLPSPSQHYSQQRYPPGHHNMIPITDITIILPPQLCPGLGHFQWRMQRLVSNNLTTTIPLLKRMDQKNKARYHFSDLFRCWRAPSCTACHWCHYIPLRQNWASQSAKRLRWRTTSSA